MARTCECEHPQSQHKLSKGGCRALDCYCSKFVSAFKPEPDPDPEPQPVDEAARAEQTTADIEATGHLPVIEIQPGIGGVSMAEVTEAMKVNLPALAAAGSSSVSSILGSGPAREYAKGGIVLSPGGDLGRAALDAIKAYEQGSGTAWRGEAPATEATSAALRRVEQERDEALEAEKRVRRYWNEASADRDLIKAELTKARTAYLAQSAGLTSARTELEQVKRDWDSLAVELANVKDAATRKVTAMLEAQTAPAEPPLWQYTVWFCQPATGCGQRYSQDQPDHECGPLTAAVVTITRQPEGAPAA
jgi:hypothetical protein